MFFWGDIAFFGRLIFKIIAFALFLHVMTYIGPYVLWLVGVIIAFLRALFEPLLP